MSIDDARSRSSESSFELLAGLTARLASTAKLDEIVDTVLREIVELGFGAVWMAVLDESSQQLLTLKEVIDGVDTTHEMPRIFALDMRQPIGRGFSERRMINITDPDGLHIIERDDEPVPPDALALPRVIYQHMRGHPFACGPLLGSRGQPVGALGLSSYRGQQPIPDRLFAHGLLRAFMDHLGIAMERALHNTRLERLNAELVKAQAAIAADARVKAVGELAAAVAHDLNNLSGVALMSVSVGLRSPEQAMDVLPRIERATRSIGELVGRLQRVARHGAAPAGEHEDVSHLEQIVEDILAMVKPVMNELAVEVTAELPEVPPVRCDPALIHQVVLNLLLNAHDALADMPPGRRKIRVRLRDDDGVVRVIVSDSGPGIAPEVLRDLFRPFVTTKSGGHAGLGLAAAHASLKHFGGEISGRNARSGGAVFEISLEPAPLSERPGGAAAPPLPDLSRERRARILVIDDDPDVVFVVREYLEQFGYQVVEANDVDLALALARSQSFDLILCDVGMPKRSGLELAREIREGGFTGKLVLMTGWDTQTVGEDRRAAVCDGMLKKPFLGAELVQLMDELLTS